MKFFISILCLLVNSFAAYGETNESNLTARWEQELSNFQRGVHYMTNDEGTLVELTVSPKPLTGGGRHFGDKIEFYLYNNKMGRLATEFKYDLLPLADSVYDLSIPTVFVTHGWMNSRASKSCTLIVDAYLERGGYNVVVVDWSSMSKNFYEVSAWLVVHAGAKVSEMIQTLAAAKYLRIDETILVGHSLGAHVMGIAGYALNGAVRGVFGLDPALPLFWFASPVWRISNQSAQYVEIIHTNAGVLGVSKPLGHVDFYVNGGFSQPHCGFDLGYACSHNRAYELYAESVKPTVVFWGRKCRNEDEFKFKMCTGLLLKMGGASPGYEVDGTYVVRVNFDPQSFNKP